MYADALLLPTWQTLNDSMWTWIIFAAVAAAIALAFGIYNAQRGIMPSQRQAMAEMQREIEQHQKKIDMLLDQATVQWAQSMANKEELAKLRVENTQLRQLTQEQAATIAEQGALIKALQRQLAGSTISSRRAASSRLRATLTSRLSEDDLRAWASDLDVPFESLAGETLPARIIAMLDTLRQHNRFDEGLQELHKLRPDISWDEMT